MFYASYDSTGRRFLINHNDGKMKGGTKKAIWNLIRTNIAYQRDMAERGYVRLEYYAGRGTVKHVYYPKSGKAVVTYGI